MEENNKLKDLIFKEKSNEIKMKEFLDQKKKEEKKEIRTFRQEMFIEDKKRKPSFEKNLRNKHCENFEKEKEREISRKREQEKSQNDKKREESLEKLQNIMFIRENKKKLKEQEIKNQVSFHI